MRRRCRGKEEPWEEQDLGRERSLAIWQPGGWKISAAARQRAHLRVGDVPEATVVSRRKLVAAIPSIAAPAEAEAAEKVRDFRVPVGAPAGVGQGGELRLVGWGAKNSGLVASCGRLAPTRRPR